MGDIIPFDQVTKGDLATLQNAFAADTSMVVSSGFPALSIKGSKWAIVRNGDREVVMNPQTGDPAYSLHLSVIAFNPNISKTFYEGEYEDGVAGKPTCYSNDGVGPAADAQVPQAKKCAACPHNQWGSRITEQGKKAKACNDTRRLAVANPDQLNDPMLLRIPPTSMAPLGDYQKMLAKRNLGIEAVVTKVGFDPNASSPLLTFQPVGLITGDMANEIMSMKEDDTVQQIIGTSPLGAVVDPKEDEEPLTEYKSEAAEEVVEEVEEEVVEEKPVVKKKTTKKVAKKAAAKKAAPEATESDAKFDDDDDALFAALDGMLT